MVQVITGADTRRGVTIPEGTPAGQGTPLIHVHYVRRDVHGNGIGIKVYGELKIAAKEIVYARELKLNTLQVLSLTIEQGTHYMLTPSKWISNKGEYDNYASIDIFGVTGYEMRSRYADRTQVTVPNTLPYDGSIWVNFVALGE